MAGKRKRGAKTVAPASLALACSAGLSTDKKEAGGYGASRRAELANIGGNRKTSGAQQAYLNNAR
jgi:hypothetical protein